MTDQLRSPMPIDLQWLIDHAQQLRAQHVKKSPLFARLDTATRRAQDLGWIHQLAHVSRRFTRALVTRYLHCAVSFARAFAQHARDEVMHPFELSDWMIHHGYRLTTEPPTPATERLLAFCEEAARRGNVYEHVVILSLVSEGVALDFYTSATDALRDLGIADGRYWKQHVTGDEQHLRVGIAELTAFYAGEDPRRIERDCGGMRSAAELTASLYRDMLDSWATLGPVEVAQGIEWITGDGIPREE